MHPTNIEWHISRGPVVVTRAGFEALRVVSSKPSAMLAPPYTLCRALIGGRWHAVERQYSCGYAMYFANPITIRPKASEL